jgi:hypothetical protein
MAISHKGKRKITYKEKLYLWYIAMDDDDCYHYLKIISEDKKTYLSYRVNQIGDYFIHPKISVVESDKLQKGTYVFFPPIADEIISNYNVRAILNWYDSRENTENPIVFKVPKNPFANIEFNSGTVTHIENDFSQGNLKEDMLQVIYPKNYLLDVGWYGTMNGYIIYIIRNNDWENPVAKTHKGLYDLQEAIVSAINIIEKRINELE